jgi:hypothetical protein
MTDKLLLALAITLLAAVRKCHYDDDTWRDLQALKKAVDGDDLFHTEFTVQLP